MNTPSPAPYCSLSYQISDISPHYIQTSPRVIPKRDIGDVRTIWVGIFAGKSVEMGTFYNEICRNRYFLVSMHWAQRDLL